MTSIFVNGASDVVTAASIFVNGASYIQRSGNNFRVTLPREAGDQYLKWRTMWKCLRLVVREYKTSAALYQQSPTQEFDALEKIDQVVAILKQGIFQIR